MGKEFGIRYLAIVWDNKSPLLLVWHVMFWLSINCALRTWPRTATWTHTLAKPNKIIKNPWQVSATTTTLAHLQSIRLNHIQIQISKNTKFKITRPCRRCICCCCVACNSMHMQQPTVHPIQANSHIRLSNISTRPGVSCSPFQAAMMASPSHSDFFTSLLWLFMGW